MFARVKRLGESVRRNSRRETGAYTEATATGRTLYTAANGRP